MSVSCSVEVTGLDHQDREVSICIVTQSPDIAVGVLIGKDDCDDGTEVEAIMNGYASGESEDVKLVTPNGKPPWKENDRCPHKQSTLMVVTRQQDSGDQRTRSERRNPHRCHSHATR